VPVQLDSHADSRNTWIVTLKQSGHRYRSFTWSYFGKIPLHFLISLVSAAPNHFYRAAIQPVAGNLPAAACYVTLTGEANLAFREPAQWGTLEADFQSDPNVPVDERP